MNNSGRKWWASLAALATSLVLVTGIGASSASADHITVRTDRIVDPHMCFSTNEYDRPVWLSGSFFSAKGFKESADRELFGCYSISPNGEVQTSDGALWIYNGSPAFLNGYEHGEDIALNGFKSHWELMYGTYEINGVPTRIEGEYYVTSSGEIFYQGEFHRLGEWSDWYEAGVRNGYAAAQRRLDACLARIALVNVEPKTYGPELTFTVTQYLPEIPAERVVVGFREVSEGSRQPQIVSGEFPWCVDSWFRYATEGPELKFVLGSHSYVLSYDNEGPYYRRYWYDSALWGPKMHNEQLWGSQTKVRVTG